MLLLQSEVAQAIAKQIQVAVTPEESERLASARPVDPEAYEAYLNGRFHLYKFSPPDLETALQYFELALEKDSSYALAYTGIAGVWNVRRQMGFVLPTEATPKARAAALKAIELDDMLAEAHLSLAIDRIYYEWDWAAGEAEFRRAIELNPNYPDARVFYWHFLSSMRRPEEARIHIERALELDPFHHLFQHAYGVHLYFARRYDDAIVQARKVLRTNPNFHMARSDLWNLLDQKEMYEEALVEAQKYFELLGYREVAEALAQDYAEGGYSEALSRAAETLAARSRTTFVTPLLVARLYAHAGKKDQALDWLERAIEERDPNMVILSVVPVWDNLRDDPRFQDLLRRMNLPES